MPENNPKNPFEDHINSDSFDVSILGNSQVPTDSMEQAVIQFLDTLPQPYDSIVLEHGLDNDQKILCEVLTEQVVTRILRKDFAEALKDISDEQLIDMMTTPIMIAIMAENTLNHPTKTAKTDIAPPIHEELPSLPVPLGIRFNRWLNETKDLLIRLFRRV